MEREGEFLIVFGKEFHNIGEKKYVGYMIQLVYSRNNNMCIEGRAKVIFWAVILQQH